MTHQVQEEYRQQLDYSTNHTWLKQGDTKLLKLLNEYLVVVTFEHSENYSIIYNCSIQLEMKKHYSHSAALVQLNTVIDAGNCVISNH